MDEQQSAEDAARLEEVRARVNAEPVQQRGLTVSAIQMMAQAAELAGTGFVTGAAVETGRRLVGQRSGMTPERCRTGYSCRGSRGRVDTGTRRADRAEGGCARARMGDDVAAPYN